MKAKGFTLIEVMIVLLLITVIVSGVTIAVNSASSDKDRLYAMGRTLFAQMQFALDEALIQQRLIGLRVQTDDTKVSVYNWHYYQDERWQPLEDPLQKVTPPKEVVLQVSVDDELLQTLLENSLNDLSEEQEVPPSIIFYPNSDISEFQLILAFKDDSQQDNYQIYIDERGQLTNSLIDKPTEDDR